MSRSIPLGGIILSDLLAFTGGSIVRFPLVWWVLDTYTAPILLSLLAVCVFLPLNIGAAVSGLLVGRFGTRRLLLLSKTLAVSGPLVCALMLAAGVFNIEALLVLTVLTYAALTPSLTADTSRVPALSRFSGRRIATFHAADRTVVLLARPIGLAIAGLLVERVGVSATVGVGTLLLAGSLGVTMATFPRDRPGRVIRFHSSTWRRLTRSVLEHEAIASIGRGKVFGVALLVAAGAALFEVVVPLVSRANSLPVTSLSFAMTVTAAASVVGAVAYRLVDGRIGFRQLTVFTAGAIPLAVLPAVASGSFAVVVASAVATTAGGSLLATGLATNLQHRLPASLQAQMIALWQSLALSTTVAVLVVVGVLGVLLPASALWTLAALAFAGLAPALVPNSPFGTQTGAIPRPDRG